MKPVSGPDTEKAPYAQQASASLGRRFSEKGCAMRSPFQRDKDRIVHSNAFRRLTHKTQVFVCHEGDHFRSRLTHSLEVSQIARSMARTLGLDEDLTEAVALAHDFGHTPFGHAGERALTRALSDVGGFDHNIQSLKILVSLEKRYPAFDGLNLTWETLEGILKHNGPAIVPRPEGDNRPSVDPLLEKLLEGFSGRMDLRPHEYASCEAQIAALSDDIAYNNHDLDDGLRGGLYHLEDLRDIPLVYDILRQVRDEFPGIDEARQVYELNRRLITIMIVDVVGQTRKNAEELELKSAEDVRLAGRLTACFSPEFEAKLDVLRAFLLQEVYHHKRIVKIMDAAEQVVEDLAGFFMKNPEKLPSEWQVGEQAGFEEQMLLGETVRNYVAGMTDRYALELHGRLFDHTPKLR